MHPISIIEKKRDNKMVSQEEINFLVRDFVAGIIPEYQMSAFLMAVCLRGMNEEETSFLTSALLNSGQTIAHKNQNKALIDKHSTGGIGDKISIPLVPAVAACGLQVPMIAGRGLGHTGGTIDKLEAIPKFRTNLNINEYRDFVADIGCVIMSQTEQIAPADKKLYALRDVTGTVESLPLIASSIMSKKLAEGIDGLVLDVKFGSGAFLPDLVNAQALANTMVNIGRHMNKKVTAILTNMNEPIGSMVGNTLEIIESIDILHGHGPKDSMSLTVELGAEMLVLGRLAKNLEEGRKQIIAVLNNGQAFDKFVQMVKIQGGDLSPIYDTSKFEMAPKKTVITAEQPGYAALTNCREIGTIVKILGGGREILTDNIDHRVGIEIHIKTGEYVNKGQPLCTIHSDDKGLHEAIIRTKKTFSITTKPVPKQLLINDRISFEH